MEKSQLKNSLIYNMDKNTVPQPKMINSPAYCARYCDIDWGHDTPDQTVEHKPWLLAALKKNHEAHTQLCSIIGVKKTDTN